MVVDLVVDGKQCPLLLRLNGLIVKFVNSHENETTKLFSLGLVGYAVFA